MHALVKKIIFESISISGWIVYLIRPTRLTDVSFEKVVTSSPISIYRGSLGKRMVMLF